MGSKRHNNPWDIINPEPLDEHALAGLKAQPVHPADRAVEAIGALRSTLKSGEAYSGHLEKLAQRGIEAIRDLEEQFDAMREAIEQAWSYGSTTLKSEDYYAIQRLLDSNPACEHEWVDARNERVLSGEMCVKCHAMRASNPASRDDDSPPRAKEES